MNKKKLITSVVLVMVILLFIAYNHIDSGRFKTAKDSDLNNCISLYEENLNKLNIKYSNIKYEKVPDNMSLDLGYNCESYYFTVTLDVFPENAVDDLRYLFYNLPEELRQKYNNFISNTEIRVGNDIYTGNEDYIFKNHNQYMFIGHNNTDSPNSISDENNITPLEITEKTILKDGDYWFCKGTVSNNSNITHSYVKIRVTYLDKDNEVLTTDTGYADNGDGIRAGENQQFEIMTKVTGEVEYYKVEIQDFE